MKQTAEIIFTARRGCRGFFKEKKRVRVQYKKFLTDLIPMVVDLERGLNNGMLYSEATAAYPRIGMHNKEVWRLHLRAAHWSGSSGTYGV